MAGTTNNVTWWNATTTTGDCDTLWFPYYSEPDWEPYTVEKYEPKWHIKKGYKNQIKHMWD